MAREDVGVRVLQKVVDGLDVSIFGSLRPDVLARLEAEKRALRVSRRGIREYRALHGVPGKALVLTGEGGGGRFVFQSEAIKRLRVTNRGKHPQLMIQFRARTLHEHDLVEMEKIVGRVAGHFLEPGFRMQVRRFDLAVDFQCAGWQAPQPRDVICRAGHIVHGEGGTTTGITFGSRQGPLQIQVYNKTRELRDKRKGWMEASYATKESYDESLPIIRVELRFPRRLLRSLGRTGGVSGRYHGIDTVSDLRAGVGDLIRYAVGGDGRSAWVRVASPDTRHRRSERRGSVPWWREICDALLEGEPKSGRVRQRYPSSTPNLERYLSTMVAYAVKAAALQGAIDARPTPPPQDYLGHEALQHIPSWLKHKPFGSFREAVEYEIQQLRSSGRVP